MQGEPQQNQRKGPLTRMQVVFLVFVCVSAIVSMVAAPDGAVSGMLARITGSMAGSTNLEIHASSKELGDYSFIDQRGKKRSFSEYRGKVVVVSFWALWCPSCKAEKPGLDLLAGEMKKSGLEVITLSSDDAKKAMQYYANHSLHHLEVSTDEDDTIFSALGFSGIPASIVIDKDGKEVGRSVGFVDWQDADVKKFLRGLLEAKTGAES